MESAYEILKKNSNQFTKQLTTSRTCTLMEDYAMKMAIEFANWCDVPYKVSEDIYKDFLKERNYESK